MREWLSGRASPCQGERREFESRLPLQQKTLLISVFCNMAPWPSGKAKVCKTSIPRFKSGWRLQKKTTCFKQVVFFNKINPDGVVKYALCVKCCKRNVKCALRHVDFSFHTKAIAWRFENIHILPKTKLLPWSSKIPPNIRKG